MAHLYRQHRSHTYRHISNNLNNQFEQTHNNTHHSGIHAKPHNKHLQNNSDIPLAYYFDKAQKRKIIKNMIQSYFEHAANPQLIKHRNFINQKNIGKMKREEQKFSTINQKSQKVESKNNIQFLQDIKIKDMSKTVGAKFFSHRSFVENSSNNLPIIEQVHQHANDHKRPHSQHKIRQLIQSPLKRRQSAGFNPRKQIQLINKSQLSNRSQQLIDSDIDIGDMSQSLILSKATSVVSRNSSQSNKSYTKQCKYYSFKYSKQKIVKNFNNSGMFLLARQAKLKKYGAKTLWNQNPYFNQLILQKHQPLSKQLYYKISKIHGQQSIQIIYPHQQIYKQLFKNNSQWLRDIIIQICKQLITLKDKIIINKITIDNICRLGQKQIRIIDWSGASLRQQIVNLDKNSVVKITQPILKQKQQNNQIKSNVYKWICQPEYLAPQIIRCLSKQKLNDQFLWKNSSASDIWSLGCLIFQILTLIPLNAKQRYTIKGRSYNRKGIFYMRQFSYIDLQKKQKLFSNQASRIIKKQCDNDFIDKIDPRIIQVMQKMLSFDRQKRIRAQQVIVFLSK